MKFIKSSLLSTATLLLLIEVSVIMLTLSVLGYLYYNFQLTTFLSSVSYTVFTPTISVIFFMILFGCYDPIARIDMRVLTVRHRAASITGIFFAWLYAYLYVSDWISPLYGIVMSASVFFVVQFTRTFARDISRIALLQRRIFFIGTPSSLEDQDQIKNFVGTMTFEEAADEELLMTEISALQVNEIVIGSDSSYQNLPTQSLLECKTQGIKITPYVSYFERENKRVSLEHIYPQWFIFTSGFHYTSFDRFLKRTIDIIFALAGIIISLPILLIVTVLIKTTSKGPVFYQQIRIGLNGERFTIKKFRSMSVDAEKDGAQWAQSNDSRVTWIGKFIRKTRIDELPQLFNILRGEMSLVGPRPERPVFVEQLSEKIPYYRDRHRVKPGLTGWAQVNYPYGASEDDARMKLAYDLYYMKNFSIALDILTMFKTVRVVLFGDGAR